MMENTYRRPFWTTEILRIAKYVLITLIVNLLLNMIWMPVYRWMAEDSAVMTLGAASAVFSYGHLISSTIILTLLHRAFTFRATEKWYIAVPLMIVAAVGFRFLWAWMLALLQVAMGQQMTGMAFVNLTSMQGILWMICAYLLQRCAIYCHSIDDNWWYRRHLPATDEQETEEP